MRLRDDGILLDRTAEDEAEIGKALDELRFHVENLLAELDAVGGNYLRTSMAITAAIALFKRYGLSVWLVAGEDHRPFVAPDFRLSVEDAIADRFHVDYAADILPRGRVRGVAVGSGIGLDRGSFEVGQ